MHKMGFGVLLMALPGLLAAGAVQDLSGKWEVHVEGFGGPRTQKFDLTQKGADLSGTYDGKFGESKVSGTVKDAAVDFEMTIIENQHIVQVHYVGTATDDGGIKGTVTFGDRGKGTWVAARWVPPQKHRK